MNVIVVGCGRVGSHLANLLSVEGHNVSVIDKSSESFKSLGRDFDGNTIKGLGAEQDVLRLAGIEECDAIAVVTSNDNYNMMVAELARRIFKVKHVIARLYAPKRESAYLKLDIDFACGTSLVAEEILTKIRAGIEHHIDSIGDYELLRSAFSFPKEKSFQCRELENDFNMRIALIERDEDDIFIPKPDTKIISGDIATFCIDRTRLIELEQYLEIQDSED